MSSRQYTSDGRRCWKWAKDPRTGKTYRWQRENIPEFCTTSGAFIPQLWFGQLGDEPATLGEFVFHPASHATLMRVGCGYLEVAVDDLRYHCYWVGPPGQGFRATTTTSESWFAEVRRAEAKANQSEGGRYHGRGLPRKTECSSKSIP